MTRVQSVPVLYTLLALNACPAFAQVERGSVPSTPACLELNRTALDQVAKGHTSAAEATLAAAIGSAEGEQDPCAGFVLNNMAALVAASGRLAEAERLADRSYKLLGKIYPPDDPLLLRPLQILAATRFEQGKTASAREAFQRMQPIRIDKPQERALVHGIAGAICQLEGRRREAESEYRAAFDAWVEAGKGSTGDAGAVLWALVALYIEENQLSQARRTLDDAAAVFSRASDTMTLDRVKLLELGGVLHAREGKWREAEEDFRDALSIADRELDLNPHSLRSLLRGYAVVLRKNHRGTDARSIETRLAALGHDSTTDVVDVTDLLAKTKRAAK